MRSAHGLEGGQETRILLHWILQDLVVGPENQSVRRKGCGVNDILSGKALRRAQTVRLNLVAKRAGDTIHGSLVKVMSGIEKTRDKNLDRRRRDVCNRLVARHAHMAPAAFVFDYTFTCGFRSTSELILACHRGSLAALAIMVDRHCASFDTSLPASSVKPL